jgi:hypothetical protein
MGLRFILLVTFILGIAIGYFLYSFSAPAAMKEPIQDNVKTSPQPHPKLFRSEIEELQQRLAFLEKENAPLNMETSNLKKGVEADVPTKFIKAKIHDDHGHAHDDLTQLLELTHEEQAKINVLFGVIQNQINQLIQQRTTVLESSPTKVLLKVSGFPEEGKTLQQQFYSTMQQILGKERFEVFKELNERENNNGLFQNDDFKEHTVKLTMKKDYLQIDETYLDATSSLTHGNGYTLSSSGSFDIESRRKIYLKWLSPQNSSGRSKF